MRATSKFLPVLLLIVLASVIPGCTVFGGDPDTRRSLMDRITDVKAGYAKVTSLIVSADEAGLLGDEIKEVIKGADREAYGAIRAAEAIAGETVGTEPTTEQRDKFDDYRKAAIAALSRIKGYLKSREKKE